MTNLVAVEFQNVIAQRIEAEHQMLATRWLEQMERLTSLAPSDVFPGDRLLGDVPAVILELATFVRVPDPEPIAANSVVIAAATELGQLRHAQQASVHQVLREYRLLRKVIGDFIAEETFRLQLAPSARDLFQVTGRLDDAIDVLLQTSVATFVDKYTHAITQHASKLEGFNRTVMHELRQPLGTLQFALKSLASPDAWADRANRDRILATAERNVTRMGDTLAKLVALSRAPEGADNALLQRVELSQLVSGVAEQLDEMASVRAVDIRVSPSLPTVTVDIGRLELILLNLISNAIKYSDPEKPVREVVIDAVPSSQPDVCTLRIRDNGLGIAEPELRAVFGRFYRGHSARDQELGTSGMGLGLSIVADCVQALKGDIRVESKLGEGTTFFLDLPVAPEI
jgi:signal transduction histidine kinase